MVIVRFLSHRMLLAAISALPCLSVMPSAFAAEHAPPITVRSVVTEGRRLVLSNLYDVRSGGWVAFGKPGPETLEQLPIPHTLLMEKLDPPPFPAAQTLRVTHDRPDEKGKMVLYNYAWLDGVYHIRADQDCAYVINAETAWLEVNGQRVPPCSLNDKIYILSLQKGDRVRFRSTGWAPRAVRLPLESAPEDKADFPLRAITPTEHDYNGAFRAFAGETNWIQFLICRRTPEIVDSGAYDLVIDVPSELHIADVFGSGSKMIPLAAYPVTREPLAREERDYIRYTVPLETFLSDMQAFLAAAPAYPQASFIGSASIFLPVGVPLSMCESDRAIFWRMTQGSKQSEEHVLRLESFHLADPPAFPRQLGVCLSVSRFASAGPEALGVGYGSLLRKCGIRTVLTSDKTTAFRMKKAGLGTIFFTSYNPGFGGVDIRGQAGRICTQKRILDGGEYYRQRFLTFGADMLDAFEGYELDFEPRGTTPNASCFCKDCREAFSRWSGIDVTDMPAQTIWGRYPDRWVAFRQAQYREVHRIYADTVRGLRPNYKVWLNGGGDAVSDFKEMNRLARTTGINHADLDPAIDLFSPYFYDGISTQVKDSFRFHQALFSRTAFAPWAAISFGVGGRGPHVLSAAGLRQHMFLWFAMGAPVFKIWNENKTSFDALSMVATQRTLGEIARCEDYYTQGDAVDDDVRVAEPSDTESVLYTAHRLESRTLVTLFNIDADGQNKTLTVRVAMTNALDIPCMVRNFLTGEQLFGEASQTQLTEGIEVSVAPKDVLLLEVAPAKDSTR